MLALQQFLQEDFCVATLNLALNLTPPPPPPKKKNKTVLCLCMPCFNRGEVCGFKGLRCRFHERVAGFAGLGVQRALSIKQLYRRV